MVGGVADCTESLSFFRWGFPYQELEIEVNRDPTLDIVGLDISNNHIAGIVPDCVTARTGELALGDRIVACDGVFLQPPQQVNTIMATHQHKYCFHIHRKDLSPPMTIPYASAAKSEDALRVLRPAAAWYGCLTRPLVFALFCVNMVREASRCVPVSQRLQHLPVLQVSSVGHQHQQQHANAVWRKYAGIVVKHMVKMFAAVFKSPHFLMAQNEPVQKQPVLACHATALNDHESSNTWSARASLLIRFRSWCSAGTRGALRDVMKLSSANSMQWP